MKVSLGKIASSVRSSFAKVTAKGAELKDAVVPVLTGPVKPPPAYYYCADGSTVLGPISPDALYELVWRHESIPQDVPVSLAGVEQWVPFLSLDETLFSNKLVQEITKARAQKVAEQIRRAAEVERARVEEAKQLAAMEQRRRRSRAYLIVLGICALFILGLGLLPFNGPAPQDHTTRTIVVQAPPAPSPTPEIRTIYITPGPTPTPRVVYITPVLTPSPVSTPSPTYTPASSLSDTTWVNGYTRKDGTYVRGHSRKK